jgi:hypothetical protein
MFLFKKDEKTWDISSNLLKIEVENHAKDRINKEKESYYKSPKANWKKEASTFCFAS